MNSRGKADDDINYGRRKSAHNRKYDKEFDYEEVYRGAETGKDLEKIEQVFIDRNGGPTNKGNPNGGTSNKRNNFRKKVDKLIKNTWKSVFVGDVFGIYIDDVRFYPGQIVLTKGECFFVVVFCDECTSLNQVYTVIESSQPVIFAETTDAEFRKGNWIIIGRSSFVFKYPNPYHVVCMDPLLNTISLCDFFGNKVRDASEVEFKYYGYKLSVSPVKITNAIKCYSDGVVNAEYGRIMYKSVLEKCVLI